MSYAIQTSADGWAKDFSYDYYRRLVRTLRENFELCTLSEYRRQRSDSRRTAFMRHDVDVCVERAVEMARVEHELGVRSTYMVNPGTPLYEVGEERDLLHFIHELGHEVALHCNLTPSSEDDTTGTVNGGLSPTEMRQIEDARCQLEAVGIEPITSLSFHQPSKCMLGGPRTIAGMVNAYNPDLMSAYISDSSGRWREGDPLETITAEVDTDYLQVLTHPVWWAESHEPPHARLTTVADKFDVLDERMYGELVSILGTFREQCIV